MGKNITFVIGGGLELMALGLPTYWPDAPQWLGGLFVWVGLILIVGALILLFKDKFLFFKTPNFVNIEQAVDHAVLSLYPDYDGSVNYQEDKEIPMTCKAITKKLREGKLVALGRRTEAKIVGRGRVWEPHSTDPNKPIDKKEWEYRELEPILAMVPHSKDAQTTSSGSGEDHIQLTALKVDLNKVKKLWPVENT